MISRNIQTIYVMWLRDMKGFMRSKARIISTLALPFGLLLFMGFGFGSGFSMVGVPKNVNYLSFLGPGIIGMTMLMNSIFAGISVLWDKEFGFLKEIIVAPVERWAIVAGRIAGGITTGLIQGILILIIAFLMGLQIINPIGLLLAVAFMILIGIGFVGFGVAMASIIEDTQAFSLIMQFIISPAIFLSGAFFPLANFPLWLRIIALIDPLVYGIDGLRFSLIGVSQFPIYLNLTILIVFDSAMVFASTWLFSKTKG